MRYSFEGIVFLGEVLLEKLMGFHNHRNVIYNILNIYIKSFSKFLTMSHEKYVKVLVLVALVFGVYAWYQSNSGNTFEDISSEEISLVADAIVEDLDKEADEALPPQLSPSTDDLELSEQDEAELQKLLSGSTLLSLGMSLLPTLPKKNPVDAIESAREKSEQKAVNDQVTALDNKQDAVQRQKKTLAENNVTLDNKLKIVQSAEIKSIESKNKLRDAEDDSVLSKELLENKEQSVERLTQQVSDVKSGLSKRVKDLKNEHSQIQSKQRQQIEKMVADAERIIEESPKHVQESMRRDLDHTNNSLQKDFDKTISTHKKQESKLVSESNNILDSVRRDASSIIKSEQSAIEISHKNKQEKQLNEDEKIIQEKKKQHVRERIVAGEDNRNKNKQLDEKLVSLRKKSQDIKTDSTNKQKKQKKHPRSSKKGKISVKTRKNSDNSTSFSLTVPSDLKPEQVDEISITVSEESSEILNRYQEIKDKIKVEKSLKNLTKEEKDVIRSAGIEYSNFKKEYVKKRTNIVKKRRDSLKAEKESKN